MNHHFRKFLNPKYLVLAIIRDPGEWLKLAGSITLVVWSILSSSSLGVLPIVGTSLMVVGASLHVLVNYADHRKQKAQDKKLERVDKKKEDKDEFDEGGDVQEEEDRE
jgi:hypothetical protein